MRSKPIVILGAGRSGTKILRDALTRLPGYGTWPCDELPFMWRYRNANVPHDEFDRNHARPDVRAYIRQSFERQANNDGLDVIVEKTCAKSLRPDFVDAVLPEATFVEITRDGRDVVASAAKRWTGSTALRYSLRKARYVPLGELPFYAAQFAWNRLGRLTSETGRLRSWGPRFAGMREALSRLSLDEVCALQWQACVRRTRDSLKLLPPDRVVRVSYETLARTPAAELERVTAELGSELPTAVRNWVAANIRASSVGNWQRALPADTVKLIENHMGDTLEELGYAR